MIKIIGKSGNLANLFKSTTTVGASSILPIVPAVPEEEKQIIPEPRSRVTAYTAARDLPAKKIKVVTGPTATFSVRYNHTDVKVPDFTPYRLIDKRDPTKKVEESEYKTKIYTSVSAGVLGISGVYAAKGVITKLVSSITASANVLALAKIEIDKSDIPEGKNVVFKWRGKPLFVRHRTMEEITTEGAVDLSILKDPEPDSVRARDPEWLIVVGVCTHLGCIPIAYQGDWKGYYCPCHGSHYDAAGRIRKGPAPINLEIPPYEFVDNNKIIVG